jgi:adenosine 3'-phospho 5'-phosphosulfate transporter B2
MLSAVRPPPPLLVQVSTSLLDTSRWGMLLMLGYLLFDGFTSTFQDRLFSNYNMTTYNQILYTTLWSSLLSKAKSFAGIGRPIKLCYQAGRPPYQN